MSDLKQSEKLDNSIDNMARAAVGLDEESLLKEFEEARALLEEGKAEPELYVSKAECEMSFNRLLKLMETRGLSFDTQSFTDKAAAQGEFAKLESLPQNFSQPEPQLSELSQPELLSPESPLPEPDEPGRKTRGSFIKSKAFRRVVLVAATLAIGTAGSVMTVVGQKQLATAGNKGPGDLIVWDDGNSNQKIGALEDAYGTIAKEMEIQVLRLSYMPRELRFDRLTMIDGTHAEIQFDYCGSKAYLKFAKGNQKRISKATISDTVIKEHVENPWLNQKVPISSNVLEDGRTEYRADIVLADASYSWGGIIEKEEFLKIVRGLVLYGERE